MKLVLLLTFCITSVFAVKPMPKDDAATQLDDLVRGEQAALKAYDVAIEKAKPEQKKDLQALREDHVTALSSLSKFVEGKPDLLDDTKNAGPWGKFASAWTSSRSLLDNGAIKALQQGEEHGINEYKEALEDKSLGADLKNIIKSSLLPKQQSHLQTLKGLERL